MTATVNIVRNTESNPRNKLAVAELHFEGGKLDGLKLMDSRFGSDATATPERHVPSAPFTVPDERHDFALLRAIDDSNAQNRIRRLVLDAYSEHERQAANVAS